MFVQVVSDTTDITTTICDTFFLLFLYIIMIMMGWFGSWVFGCWLNEAKEISNEQDGDDDDEHEPQQIRVRMKMRGEEE